MSVGTAGERVDAVEDRVETAGGVVKGNFGSGVRRTSVCRRLGRTAN